MGGVQQHHAHHLVRVLAGVQSRYQTARRVGNQDIGSRDRRRVHERVQVVNHVLRRARLGHRVTATGVEERTVRVEGGVDVAHRPWPVVGADAGERGHAREDHGPLAFGLLQIPGPDVGPAAGTRFQDHRRTALAAALQIQVPPADVDEAGEVAARRGGRRRRGGGLGEARDRHGKHQDDQGDDGNPVHSDSPLVQPT